MNQFYDKILFLLALVLLGSAIALGMLQMGQLDRSADPAVSAPPSGDTYAEVTADITLAPTPEWTRLQPPEDTPLEFYDLFTPPKIFWDANTKQFVFLPPNPRPVRFPIPFGARLVAFDELPYRIQFKSYLGRLKSVDGELPNAQLIFEVIPEPNAQPITVTGYPDETEKFEPYGFRVLSGREEMVEVMDREQDSMEFSRKGFVTIFDEQLGEEVELNTREERIATGDYLLTFEQNVRPFEKFELTEAGQSFGFMQEAQTWEETEVSYELLQLDFDGQRAEVLKADPRLDAVETDRWPDGQEPLQQWLVVDNSPRQRTAAPSTEGAATPSDASNDEEVNINFF
ncbi:MAG: hypothetical protein ACFBZ8_01060 [Opitutales bacterium]